jgi:hypothetical protein
MATETELTLPTLRGLGELANTRPILVQDTREQVPLVFTRLRQRTGLGRFERTARPGTDGSYLQLDASERAGDLRI